MFSFSGKNTSFPLKAPHLDPQDHEDRLVADGSVSNWNATPKWFANIRELNISSQSISEIAKINKKTNVLTRLGDISFVGNVGGLGKDIATKGLIKTNAGHANIA